VILIAAELFDKKEPEKEGGGAPAGTRRRAVRTIRSRQPVDGGHDGRFDQPANAVTSRSSELRQFVKMRVIVRKIDRVYLRARKDEQVDQRHVHAGCPTAIGESDGVFPDIG
jgi:hypothetical protein